MKIPIEIILGHTSADAVIKVAGLDVTSHVHGHRRDVEAAIQLAGQDQGWAVRGD